MSAEEITFDAVAGRVAAVLRLPASTLTAGTMIRDLSVDSFMLVELMVDLQEEFGAVFTQARMRDVGSLGDLVGLLRDTAI